MSERNDGPNGEEDGFLQRWSRRKRGVDDGTDGLKRKSAEVDAKADVGAGVALEEPMRVDAPLGAGRMIVEPEMLYPKPEAEEGEAEADARSGDVDDDDVPAGEASQNEIAELEAIDIDALDYDADYTRFMKAGVPEALRRRALRKLWTTNPILANLDGMNDYDEDFTDAKLAVDVLQTVFKAKHGYMSDEEVAAQERLGREHLYDEDGNFIGEGTQVAEAAEEGEAEEPDAYAGDDAGDDAEARVKRAAEVEPDDDNEDDLDDGDTDFG